MMNYSLVSVHHNEGLSNSDDEEENNNNIEITAPSSAAATLTHSTTDTNNKTTVSLLKGGLPNYLSIDILLCTTIFVTCSYHHNYSYCLHALIKTISIHHLKKGYKKGVD